MSPPRDIVGYAMNRGTRVAGRHGALIMSHSLSQLTSRVSRLAEQVERAGVSACRKNHTPMPLVFTVREGEPYPTVPERPAHYECGHPLRYPPSTVHVITRG